MKVLFFASFRERLGVAEEQWESLNGIENLTQLLQTLRDRGEPWASTLEDDNILAAINQEMVPLDSAIQQNDEVAFFPPVTGG